MLRSLLRSSLKPRAALPHLDAIEHHAWRQGWWQALPVGFVVGLGLAVVLLKA